MSGNSINIKNFNWNLVVLKNFAKTSKNYHFSAQLVQKWGRRVSRPIQEAVFFSEITKPVPKSSKPFILIKYHMFWLN